jgi:lysophospholipase L1-like esterase
LLLPLAAEPAGAARIVVFGDSWGVPAAPALQQVLSDHGLPDTVANAAVPGETAADLSKPPGLQHITDTLAAHLDADLVHLSIGGNDFLGQWSSTMPPSQEAALFAAILDDVETIVDHILTVRPGVEILWSSYDFSRPLPLGTPTEVNAASLAFSVQAAAFADVKGPGVTYGDFNGLMQVTFGFDDVQYTLYDPPIPIPPGDPSLPDPTVPSPYVAFSDAIHLTAEGYLILADGQFDAFYAERLLGEAPPVPALGWPTQGVLAALLLATGTTRSRRQRLPP